jgi:hypothetical protein
MATKRHKKHKGGGSAWRAAEAAGFDMSLVEVNLRMTPWERVVSHGRALRTALMLRAAMEQQHGRT